MIGKIYKSNNFGKFEIISFTNKSNVVIKFIDTGCIKKTTMQRIQNGDIKDDLAPTIEGVGINDWKYSKYYTKKRSSHYFTWVNMIRRSYNTANTFEYENTYCDGNWLRFSCFLDDIHLIKNYDKKGWHLDKDILFKGNRLYSKDTCCFVPKELNNLIISARLRRGDYPIGVNYHKEDKKFYALINISGKRKHLGNYDNVEDAFYAYKKAKEENIKLVADYYKNQIAENVYESLYNWKIEITD